jgi:hypothetical protein
LTKMLVSTKHSHRQNIGVDKMLALTKYLCRQNVGINKILASTKCWRQQNTSVDKILASAWENPLIVWLGRVHTADFSQTSLKISFFFLMVLFLYVVTKCGVSSARSNFMDGLSPVLYRLTVLACHAENVQNFCTA